MAQPTQSQSETGDSLSETGDSRTSGTQTSGISSASGKKSPSDAASSGPGTGTAASMVIAELNIPFANLVMGVLRSINSTANAQFVSSYQLDFSGPIGLYISEDFIEENNIIFAIARRSVDAKWEYFSLNIGSDVTTSLKGTSSDSQIKTLELEYSSKEAAAIKFGGLIVNPSLDDEIIVPPHRYYCNTIEKQKMSYDSLSSIGAVTQEGISVSATNTIDLTTFETTDGAITDVGGLYATGVRENEGDDSDGTLAATVTIGSGY